MSQERFSKRQKSALLVGGAVAAGGLALGVHALRARNDEKELEKQQKIEEGNALFKELGLLETFRLIDFKLGSREKRSRIRGTTPIVTFHFSWTTDIANPSLTQYSEIDLDKLRPANEAKEPTYPTISFGFNNHELASGLAVKHAIRGDLGLVAGRASYVTVNLSRADFDRLRESYSQLFSPSVSPSGSQPA